MGCLLESTNDVISALQEVLAHHSGVANEYRHAPKQVGHGQPIASSSCVLKWYEIYRPEMPVPDHIRGLARASIENSRLDVDGLGFVVLHRCSPEFYFLIVCTWKRENELWETIWYKDGNTMADFAEFPRSESHKPAFCVWELVPVWHERQSWERFLRGERDLIAAERWLADLYSGTA